MCISRCLVALLGVSFAPPGVLGYGDTVVAGAPAVGVSTLLAR